ncbi:MAG: hypothetical protein HOP27_13690 [Anaerolineales bacterium]|nr:hypothetical protein [Anaerolineales bacterium]
MTNNICEENIEKNLKTVNENRGPSVFVAVTGSEQDKNYWQEHFEAVRGELFRHDKSTLIISVSENVRKGNFLGTLNAWLCTKKEMSIKKQKMPNIVLVSMIFGQGKRLAPFTQVLGNRKSAFPLPYNSKHEGLFLCSADLSCLYSNLWVEELENSGFRGVIVKWGDEAIIPGNTLNHESVDLKKVDGIRFFWKRNLTEDLTRDKESLLVEKTTGLVLRQYARGNYENLKNTLSVLPFDKFKVGVNLGSLAISYDFLDIAAEVFKEDINNPSKWVDWDPYIWIALHCESESQWHELLQSEKNNNTSNLSDLVERFPDLYQKITQVKLSLQYKTSRDFAAYAFDFGEPYWADFGLHRTLRQQFESLLEDSDIGIVSRKLFQIPEELDENGNRIIRSVIPPDSKIFNSIIIDSVITDSSTYVNHGLIVGGTHKYVYMPEGGSALFCAVGNIEFDGPHGIAFLAVGMNIVISKGGRHTTLPEILGFRQLVGNESIIDLKGENYDQKILGNELSFAEVEKLMSIVDPKSIDLLQRLHKKIRLQGWEYLEK